MIFGRNGHIAAVFCDKKLDALYAETMKTFTGFARLRHSAIKSYFAFVRIFKLYAYESSGRLRPYSYYAFIDIIYFQHALYRVIYRIAENNIQIYRFDEIERARR